MPADPRSHSEPRPVTEDGTSPEADTPTDIKVKLAEQQLILRWGDGRERTYALAWLRRHCPCATCREEHARQEKSVLPVLSHDPAVAIRATGAALVGKYAICFTWSDGHNTGIYDFHFLGSLPPA